MRAASHMRHDMVRSLSAGAHRSLGAPTRWWRGSRSKTIIKTNIKYVLGDFAWPIRQKQAGIRLRYVIGGMDPGFKLKLYRALRAMEDAGHMPGITSAFRDDYRQSIATGHKAASDSSYHGGSRRGGYGYGLAADLVSVKGENRSQRHAAIVAVEVDRCA